MTGILIHRAVAAAGRLRWADPKPSRARQDAEAPRENASEQLAVNHKAGVLGDLVVELLRGVVGLVRLPIHAAQAGTPRLFINAVDKCSADASSACRVVGKQILQIADRLDGGRAAVEQ